MPAPQKKLAFTCPSCHRDSWLLRQPVYDDSFRKTGEKLLCALCRREFASESEIPFSAPSAPRIFTDADRPKPAALFSDDEKGRCCRHCAEYVVNPFVQRCGLHHCEVEATDCCPHFAPRPATPPENPLG